MLDEAEAAKQQKAAQASGAAGAEEKTLLDWAARLGAYKADSRPGAKGQFGIPTEDIDTLLAARPAYEEAKGLYAKFLDSGLDKDAHAQLRQAEYDIRVAILNYEGSRERVPSGFIPHVKYLFAKVHHLKGDLGKAVELYSDREHAWIKAQVEAYVFEQSNFLGESWMA